MRIRHLNCGTLEPLGGPFIQRRDQAKAGPAQMVCHCLLIETEQGLVLVDSGLGSADVERANQRLGRMFVATMRPRLQLESTALHQVRQLGYDAGDVRHIVLTHLDLDHAGGLSDFPKAKVHVLAAEHEAAQARSHWKERDRYRPTQWAHAPDWALYRDNGEDWFGFRAVRDLEGLPPEILLIPLAGHTRGHTGVAVDHGQGWLLHAGDAYFHTDEVLTSGAGCPIGLRLFQQMLSVDNARRRHNQERLRELAITRGDQVDIFCAHDPNEWQRHVGAG